MADWETHNPSGSKRVVCTKQLPGTRWLEVLAAADCSVEVGTSTDILSVDEIKAKIGDSCDGVIGQLTEDWGEELFSALKAAGGKVYADIEAPALVIEEGAFFEGSCRMQSRASKVRHLPVGKEMAKP